MLNTTDYTYNNSPVFWPNGRKILYVSERDTYDLISVNVDGTGEVNLTSGDGIDYWTPTISPDGTKIVASGDGVDGYGLYILNADGSNPKLLTQDEDDYSPSFSPDGKYIVFSRWDDVGAIGINVYIMKTDGTGVTPLTTTQDSRIREANR